ncbi:DUF4159 domain-containing protein [soil metagenome]
MWRSRISSIFSTILIGLTLLGAGQRPARAATVDDVDKAVKKAVDFLYSKQVGSNWESGSDPTTKQFTGQSALAIYALLAAGEKPSNNPKLAAAIDWLKKNDTKGIYALGCRAQVWNLIPHEKDPAIVNALRRDAALLLEGAKKADDPRAFRGLYHYEVASLNSYDSSCSQYGVLGIWAMERSGLEVSDDYWKAVEKAWKTNQNADKGWSYIKKDGAASTINMTAAGIATLFITQDYLSGMNGLKCTGNTVNPVIDSGMGWMEKNLPPAFKGGTVVPYGMYGIERIGVASGYKYFGSLDWYKEGSEYFVKRAKPTGGWGEVPSTAFGILFLCRGRAPVVMNKLEYDIAKKEANWNQRPRDAANVVKYIAKQMERDLNWQIVNLKVSVDDFHDGPILYISGNQALKFTDEEEAKLKQFVEQGGLILGNADCASAEFSKTFKALGMKLFKDAGEFREIDGTHPMFTRQRLWKTWKTKPVVQGLSNKVRELMLLIPSGDPAKAWQQADNKSKEDQFQLLSEIFNYTSEGQDLRYKGATYIVKAKPEIKATRSIKVARLDMGENPNPEPGSWRRLAAVMHNDYATDVETAMVKPDGDALKDYKVAHLTGTGKFKMTDEQMKAVKAFVEGGGTLIIDAAGGDTEFASGAEDALHTMFGDDAKQLSNAILASHEVYNSTGSPMGEISFRSFARGKVPRGQITPLVRGITLNKRLAVIFSREDITGGMVGESVDGLIGYAPDSAMKLMTNFVAYAIGGVKPPAPATKPAAAPAKGPAATNPAAPAKPKDAKPAAEKPAAEKPAKPAEEKADDPK